MRPEPGTLHLGSVHWRLLHIYDIYSRLGNATFETNALLGDRMLLTERLRNALPILIRRGNQAATPVR